MAPAWNAGWAEPSWWQKDRARSPERSCRMPRRSTTRRPAGRGRAQELWMPTAQPCRPTTAGGQGPGSLHQAKRGHHGSVPRRGQHASPTPQHVHSARRGGAGDWRQGWAVTAPSLRETHHEAGASLRAGQLAGARNLAHHQGLKLLELLQEGPANGKNRIHEGSPRHHGAPRGPGPELQDSCRDFVAESEERAEGQSSAGVTGCPGAQSQPLSPRVQLLRCSGEEVNAPNVP